MTLAGKTVFITGGSRGIGLAIAKRFAGDGANIVLAAKTAEPHPKLPGTIYTAAEEIEVAGGKALPLVCDVRFEDQVSGAVAAGVDHFGAIDILVNNASAISLTGTLATDLKRYDLMNEINARGTFLTTKICLPHLVKSTNPHVLNLAPPLDLDPKWFAPHVAYTIAKMGMSLCTLGHAREFAADGVAVNSLWPLTAIDTAAIRNLLGEATAAGATRTPQMLADAAYFIVTRPARECTGNFFIDEEVLRAEGVSDFTRYSPNSEGALMLDFFVPDDAVRRSTTKVESAYG